MADDALALELRGITKKFPGVVANDRIDFDLRRGEVHALLGENGAGKSTLMNVLYGLYHPDEGEIRIGGELVSMGSPKDAIAHGIGMVHQHFMLIPVMTVAENIVLGTEPRREGAILDLGAAEKRVRELSVRYGLAVDPRARIRNISVGRQQRVEILKALYRDAEILILDEPTAVLTPQEATELFKVLRSLADEGMSIIFISHKLNEVLSIADRITVLRRGKKIETLPTKDATEAGLAKLMVGREVLLRVDKTAADPGATMLRIDDLVVADDRGLAAVRGVSLEVAGRDLTSANARQVLDEGLGHIPEDRQARGLVLEFTLAENLALEDYRRPPDSRWGWLFPARLIARARRLLREFDVRGGGPSARAAALSGGNQQKVVIAREVGRDPRVLVAAQPTRGLDVGAIEYVHKRLIAVRDEGKAVLLISLELDEILSLSDRILVLYEGGIVGEYGPETPEEELGVAMTGGGRKVAAA